MVNLGCPLATIELRPPHNASINWIVSLTGNSVECTRKETEGGGVFPLFNVKQLKPPQGKPSTNMLVPDTHGLRESINLHNKVR